MKILSEIGAFFRSMIGFFWPLLSSAVFTVLAFYVALEDKGNVWIVWATGITAALLLLCSAFLAWQNEYRSKVALESTLFDEQPRLAIRIPIQAGSENWYQQRDGNGAMVVFMLHHLGGRVPTNIRFSPVMSADGQYCIRVKDMPFVMQDNPGGHSLDFGVWPSNRDPDEALADTRKVGPGIMLDSFVDDRPPGLARCIYPLTLTYRDLGEDRQKRFVIEYNTKQRWFEVRESV